MSYITFEELLGNKKICEGDYFKFPVRKDVVYNLGTQLSGVDKIQRFSNHEKTDMLARYIGYKEPGILEFISEATTETIELKGFKAYVNYSDILKAHCDQLYTLLAKGIITECLNSENVREISRKFLPNDSCWLHNTVININKRNKISYIGVFELDRKDYKYLIFCDPDGERSAEKRHVCFKYKLSSENEHIKVIVDKEHNGREKKPYEFIFD